MRLSVTPQMPISGKMLLFGLSSIRLEMSLSVNGIPSHTYRYLHGKIRGISAHLVSNILLHIDSGDSGAKRNCDIVTQLVSEHFQCLHSSFAP